MENTWKFYVWLSWKWKLNRILHKNVLAVGGEEHTQTEYKK